MKLVQSILTKNPCYTAGRKITVKGLMLHSVGCPQPKASVFINSWNSPSYDNACVHGFIDGNDGTVYQTLPWNHRGWHCGSGSKGSGNNTHIGVEMCEPACIKYTSGSNFTCSDTATAKAVAKRTYEAAVELFAMLCKQYSLNPTADGVIISHKEGHSRGIASNHGDPEHLWTQLGMGYTMDGFRKAVKAAMSGTSENTSGYTKIMGTAVATVEQMKAYLKGKNPSVAQSVLDMLPLYLSEGKTEGVRGDIAFAQSCLETGNFTFSGSAVTLSQNNFCGMGVTSNGLKGNSFDTPQLGIRAQIQHLKAYASTESLKNPCIDPRFKYVTRGCAEYVEWLGQQENPDRKGWAAGAGYGAKILSILKTITDISGGISSSTEVWYRVRKTWADAASQKGAFHSLDNAKRCADENAGYSVFDESGKVLYTSQAGLTPYLVKVSISDLNIRKGPGTNYAKTGKYTGQGVFTIVDEEDGKGASKWGLLKSYQKNRDGWISLDYGKRV
ncbi:N-acetylmuramoyl-L-alanine amidase [Blautia sp. An249]|uniref:N-acetylmuramoyl-L-alanine amidase n=1 Tax=Blautia sp. An249 TaxID=1965603 RepID=UPI000B3885E5|nr:N-acetylmuramoyl-L-alanine amidase [Blautia sp. An249]OUO80837.1 N-acetylmuramoyl-L-alanine amidase [Blautia sp. An249]